MQNSILSEDTICALATPIGGAIAVIRLSGPEAISIADHIFRPVTHHSLSEAKGNTLHYGEIIDNSTNQSSDLNVIDDVIISLYRAPHSYTGEDSVEISCHGSKYIIRQILLLLQANGARQAEPGEYTKRAYLNGKMDLSQAEAVADIIAATSSVSHKLAVSQLKGHVRTALDNLRERLQKLTALLELELDFSDHEELEFADRSELLTLAKNIHRRLTRLADTYRTGKAIREGIPVTIVGSPNVGKSTLLNYLIGEDRAIVSDIPGTTRDIIEDTIDIDGICIRLTDTAGLRQTTDKVEKIGIERTLKAMENAVIVLWLYDDTPASYNSILQTSDSHPSELSPSIKDSSTSVYVGGTDTKLLGTISSRNIIKVHTKSDISSKTIFKDEIAISAKTGEGIDKLKSAILKAAGIQQLQETDVVITSSRQYALLKEASASLLRVVNGLTSGKSSDLIAEDLRMALDYIADITGIERITPQSTLNLIFSSYCVGK